MSNLKKNAVITKSLKEELPKVLSNSQLHYLGVPTPRQFIKQRRGAGGFTFNYVDVSYVVKQLNAIFGLMWDFEIDWQDISTKEVIVRGKLTVKDAKGNTISKTQYGSASVLNNVAIGDRLKAAGSDSLKKCASWLGVALDVYSGEMK